MITCTTFFVVKTYSVKDVNKSASSWFIWQQTGNRLRWNWNYFLRLEKSNEWETSQKEHCIRTQNMFLHNEKEWKTQFAGNIFQKNHSAGRNEESPPRTQDAFFLLKLLKQKNIEGNPLVKRKKDREKSMYRNPLWSRLSLQNDKSRTWTQNNLFPRFHPAS